MEVLKRKRSGIKGKLTRLSNVINPKIDSEEIQIEEIEVYKEQLDEIWSELNSLHMDILASETGESETHVQEFDDIASKVDALKIKMAVARSKAKAKPDVNTRNEQNVAVADSSKSNNESFLKLPKFELPIFYGDYDKWLNFKELFLSSIDKNTELSDLRKLQYLLSSVRGSALKLISGFSLCDENYKHAWETLNLRYDNKKELAFAQISKLFNLKQVKSVSAKSIFEILDTCNEALRILLTLGLELNSLVEAMLIHLILSKLDDILRERWELSLISQDIPKFKDIVSFLEKQAKSMSTKDVVHAENKQKFFSKKTLVNNVVLNKQESQCIQCKEEHPLFRCNIFTKLPLDERWKSVKLNRLCANCLRKGHFSNKCFSNTSCKSCHKRHHTLLHRFFPINDTVDSAVVKNLNVDNSTELKESISTTFHLNENRGNTLLSTALIKVKNSKGTYVTCRALIDNGSQKSLIAKDCSERLQLIEKNTNHAISGINNTLIESSVSEVNLEFKSQFNDQLFKTIALVVKNVTTDLPNFKFTSFYWPHLAGLNLADHTFACSGPIDILIGADLYADLLLGQCIYGEKGSPAAINTHLGWLLSGRIFNSSKSVNSVVNCHVNTSSLENQLRNFWELESLPQTEMRSSCDMACEKFYEETVCRDNSGRYIVKLPFKSQVNFGDSATQAFKRFQCLENKLREDLSLKQQYVTFMNEYLQLGHMELVPKKQLCKNQVYYLPHHYVIKEDSSTTKLRVVYDASAKDSWGTSLNSTLHVGPRLQPDLFNLLLNFRTFNIAISADIEKMFRQIRVNEEDLDFQRIFWRCNEDEEIQVYRLTTVTYGTACAPFLAVKTLQQLSKNEETEFPEASQVLRSNFYVDDLLSGESSVPNAKKLVADLNALLQRGGFKLRKWASNCPEVLSDVPEEDLAVKKNITIEETQSQKILGMFWNSAQDTLQVRISPPNEVNSKRKLLSVIARIFDPLGFLSPTTIILKIMMQYLWKNKLSWDEAVPNEILPQWQSFHAEMNYLQEIKVNRKLVSLETPITKIELHGFCDASTKAYSAVFYLRVIHQNGNVTVNLVAAKTRVAPLKQITIPRLELCSALLLVKLFSSLSDSIQNLWNKVLLWTDSEIVLQWIHSDSLKDQFVRNRVAIINSMSEQTSWHHVPSVSNPADCATRGIFPKKLRDLNLWWYGPEWLSENNSNRFEPFVNKLHIHVSSSSAETVTFASPVSDTDPDELFLRYSSYSKLNRIIAWCRRFIFNCTSKPEVRLKGRLQSSELTSSLLCIVKQVQSIHFKSEIDNLDTKGILPRNSKYLPLSLFLDSEKILRVGGRLKNSSLSNDAKHPILLPKNHHLTNLIIEYFHKLALHAGTSVVLSLIRQQFWFIAGRDTVRRNLRNCITCLKFNASPSTHMMGNLPRDRVTPSRPFQKVGIDFAGPFITKPNVPRSKVKLKSYIALYVCFSTKSVHLEPVSDLSTEAFLASFRRFVSRRGLPSDVYSDNATNFKGASNYLKSFIPIVKSNDIQDFASNHQIMWHFIPPLTPHFGGLWESNIKSTKRHLLKVCGGATLNFEELATLLYQIEACLNSRPLYPLSSDPQDFEPLTPGHFLVGAPLLALPERDLTSAMSLKSRWALIQSLRAQFWSRWSKDYLHTLQSKSKWCMSTSNVHIGDLVLLKADFPTPLKWTLARIQQVFPGNDGIIRVVKLRTATGEFTRPVTKICPLPTNDISTFPGAQDVGN